MNRRQATCSIVASVLALTGQGFPSLGFSQPLAPRKACATNDHWSTCGIKIKAALTATKDPAEALSFAGEWGSVFTPLYKANAQKGWPASDQELLEAAMSKLWGDTVGQYLDPTSLAFDQALKRFFPRLAGVLGWASTAQATFFLTLLAPSPISNDFVAALPLNAEINALLRSKLPPALADPIRQRYPELFKKALLETATGPTLKMP